MKLVGAALYALRIPFVEEFTHSTHCRRASDSVVVKVVNEDGVAGFGEGAARPYVTGETPAVMVEHLTDVLWPGLAGVDLPDPTDEGLSAVDASSPRLDCRLLAEESVDIFNIRLSKCGGLARSDKLAERAAHHGVGVQVGSQVGETAILSAAGRHLAAWLPEVAFVEGSYGTLLLTEDIGADSVRFGYGGNAPVIAGSVRKGRDFVSITGEKVHLNHVSTALRAAEAESGLRVWQWRLIPDVENSRCDLLVELEEAMGDDAGVTRLLACFDEKLGMENLEYRAQADVAAPRVPAPACDALGVV